MKNPYEILGISPNASDDEVREAYRELARKYHPDNYDDSNPLKDLANEKMQEINLAYDEIQRMRSSGNSNSSRNYEYTGSTTGVYADARRLINNRKFRDAEELLSSVDEVDRTAEWHYLASILLMHRNRVNDAMRELEIACNMDPGNMEYQKAKEMFNGNSSRYGSTYNSRNTNRSSTDDACNCCANLICLDCLCECLGGDFISCI